MLYPEINDWFLMGPLINTKSLTICYVVVFILLKKGKLDAYIDKYVEKDYAIQAYRWIRVILALLHWEMLISVR